MPGRRRDQRFTLSTPWEGALRVLTDVVIEQYGEQEMWVVSTAPAHRDQVLMLDRTGLEPPETMNVRVMNSVPVLIDGVVRHRLQLAIVG